jgi:hypothetical protein
LIPKADQSWKFLRELPLVQSVPELSSLDNLLRAGLVRNNVRVKLPVTDSLVEGLIIQDGQLADLIEPSSQTSSDRLGRMTANALEMIKTLAVPEDEITVACEYLPELFLMINILLTTTDLYLTQRQHA